jgi:hypothetical protein
MVSCTTNFDRAFIIQELKIFGDRPYFRGEFARAKFIHSRLLESQGEHSKASEALVEAFTVREQLRSGYAQRLEDLSERDFEEIVAFWAR